MLHGKDTDNKITNDCDIAMITTLNETIHKIQVNQVL